MMSMFIKLWLHIIKIKKHVKGIVIAPNEWSLDQNDRILIIWMQFKLSNILNDLSFYQTRMFPGSNALF